MAWILRSHYPPKSQRPRAPEEYLWWGVLNQAARDFDRGSRSEAIDAYEFLEATGRWLAEALFGIPGDVYDRELRGRMKARSRVLGICSPRISPAIPSRCSPPLT
jgi:hypothetical protein